MAEEIKKRLEEAADDFSSEFPNAASLKIGFFTGAEHGYKEAITQAKEWLSNNIHSDMTIGSFFDSREAIIADFEADMNKLWEEQK